MKYSINRLTLAVATAFAVASPIQAFAADNKIENIQASQAGGTVVIRVDLEKAPAKDVTGFIMTNPSRIALDFADTDNGVGKKSQVVNEGGLRGINLIQSDNRTRMVLNLSSSMQYQTRVDGKSVYVTLTDSEQKLGSATDPMAAGSAIEDILFRRGKDGEARIIVELNTALPKVDVKQQGSTLVAEFPKTKVPEHLLRKLDVNDFGTSVTSIETKAVGSNVRLTVTSKGRWDYNTFQNNGQFVMEVRKQVEDPDKLASGAKGTYSGPKVSVNYHNGEVRSMLRMMAEELGLNAVISDTVQGNTTLVLKDVPADQVMDIIFDQKGLDMRKKGNVVLIAPREELSAKEKLVYDAYQQKNKLEPTHRESFALSYQKAADVAKLLNGQSVAGAGGAAIAAAAGPMQNVSRILSDRGSAVADGTTNTLFVNDTPSKLDEIRDFIKKIDTSSRQVMLEARVVEVNDKFSRNLGVRMNFLSSAKTQIGGSGVYGGGGTYNQQGQVANPITGVTGQTAGVNLPGVASFIGNTAGNVGGMLAMSLFNSSLTRILNIELAALDAEGAGKILSNPRVVTSNNVRAKIEDGSDIPVTTPGSANSPPTVTYRAAKLSLEATPQITPDGEVKMKLIIKKEEPNWAFVVQGNPEIKSSVIETEATVENGGTLVIGGVFRSNTNKTNEQVPLLGDIPYFGWLFKYQEKTTDVRELLIFITPKVLNEKVDL